MGVQQTRTVAGLSSTFVRQDRTATNLHDLLPSGTDAASVTDWGPYIRTACGSGDVDIYIPAGDYPITTFTTSRDGNSCVALVLDNTRIVGAGYGATRLYYPDSVAALSGSAIYGLDCSGSTDVTFRDFTFDGNTGGRAAQASDEALIEVGAYPTASDYATRVTIDAVRLVNSRSEAVDADGCSDMVIRGSFFEDNDGTGVHIRGTGSLGVTVIGCIFRNNAHVRLALGGANAESAAGLDYQGTGRLVVTGNTFDANARGIILHQSSVAELMGNTIDANQYTAGIWVRGSTTSAVAETVIAETSIRAGIHGILIESGRNIVVRGGIIVLNGSTTPTTDAIKASAFDGLTISGVTIRRTGGSAQDAIDISAPATSARTTVTGVKVEGVHYGVRANGAQVHVLGCDFNCTQDGVRMESGASGSVLGNVIVAPRGVFMTGTPSNVDTMGNVIDSSTAVYTSSGSGHVKADNIEDGTYTA